MFLLWAEKGRSMFYWCSACIKRKFFPSNHTTQENTKNSKSWLISVSAIQSENWKTKFKRKNSRSIESWSIFWSKDKKCWFVIVACFLNQTLQTQIFCIISETVAMFFVQIVVKCIKDVLSAKITKPVSLQLTRIWELIWSLFWPVLRFFAGLLSKVYRSKTCIWIFFKTPLSRK